MNTAFIAGTTAVLLAVLAIVFAMFETGDAKRDLLKQCVASGKNPVECRVAVYGTR